MVKEATTWIPLLLLAAQLLAELDWPRFPGLLALFVSPSFAIQSA